MLRLAEAMSRPETGGAPHPLASTLTSTPFATDEEAGIAA
jgi:hypothetical protein